MNRVHTRLSAFWVLWCALTGLQIPAHPLLSSTFTFSFEPAIEQQGLADKIETYLQRQVPGLAVTYRQVIDTLIEEGFNVYIKGGAVRDLLSDPPLEPKDIDFDYSGTEEDLRRVLDQHQWTYTQLPNQKIITIGDHRGISMESLPVSVAFLNEETSLEFTVNNIFYHCNSRCFLKGSEEGLNDLRYNRLHILVENWKRWLYRRGGYYKIFRSWKMVGKGYVYSTPLAQFLQYETAKRVRRNHDLFFQELNRYITTHFDSFNEVYQGAIAIMGYRWAKKHVRPLRSEARKGFAAFRELKDRHTYHKSSEE